MSAQTEPRERTREEHILFCGYDPANLVGWIYSRDAPESMRGSRGEYARNERRHRAVRAAAWRERAQTVYMHRGEILARDITGAPR